MKVLVICNAIDGKVNENLTNVFSAASKINSICDLFVIGYLEQGSLPAYKCIHKVVNYVIEHNANISTNVAKLLADNISSYTHVLIAADSYGKDLLPRVAGILDLSQISEIVAVISPNIFKRPMYAGNILAEVESCEDTKLLTVRTSSFDAYFELGGSYNVEKIDVTIDSDSKIKVLDELKIKLETVDLAQAKIIVSGGRSLGSQENFAALIGKLAVKLNGAVGASRAAVEEGFVSNDCQVGQTGKIVAPKLYLAIGISGAVQHIAGMKGSHTVVAINSDSNAQIFEYSDYGIVGDLFEIVPELINQL